MRPSALLLVLIAFIAALTGCGDPPPRQQPKLSPAAENRIKGQRFLQENATKPGVVTTASGLQYKVITAGDGPIPTTADIVRVHYRGSLVDGRIFEDSRDRGDAAARMPVRGLIRGWVEALQLMPVGSTWELYIPSNLAYGLENAPPNIGPNQALIFKLELIGIER